MAIRNNHWYNLNEQHFYPVDDTASAMSDEGQLLPTDIIADLRLRWPSDYGEYAFISAVSVTPHLVTVLIEAAHTLDNAPKASRLIAGVSIPRAELTFGRTYALTSFQAGAGGFIVIGSGGKDGAVYTGRFSTPRQTLLTPRAARATRRPPVQTIGVEHASKTLTGLVNLTAAAPLQLTKESRTINNEVHDNVVVVRLVEQTQNVVTNTAAESVFQKFAGPCGNRVGSRTCGDPQPIETINGVGPDCNGTLTLEFKGCALVGKTTGTYGDCGVVIDCSLGLSASCNPPYLPNLQNGLLPNELPPNVLPPAFPPTPPIPPTYSISESARTILTLPYCDTFAYSHSYGFNPVGDSLWGYFPDQSEDDSTCCAAAGTAHGCSTGDPNPASVCSYGTPATAAQSRTNISTWALDLQSMQRTYRTALKVMSGEPGSRNNGGIIINYGLSASNLPLYMAYILDFDTCRLGLHVFNGMGLLTVESVPIPELTIGEWYRLSCSVEPGNAGPTFNCRAVVRGITNPLVYYDMGSTVTNYYWGRDTGVAGLYANRSKCAFSYWRVDNYEVTYE